MPKVYTRQHLQVAAKKESEVWLYSYADLITNLLAFFILMMSMATMSPPQIEKVQESIRSSSKLFGGETNQLDNQMALVVTKFIRENDLKNFAAVERKIDGVSITFTGGVFFETLSADLTQEARTILSSLAPLFQKLPKDYRIDVSGHADSRAITDDTQFPSNWELSSARAASVVRYMVSEGVSPRKFRAIGYADTQPVSHDFDQNRRVVIKVGRGVFK